MIIAGSFYKIIPVNNSSPFYDLELLCDIGGNNPRKEFKNEAYGITLESAIIRCANFAIRSKYKKDEVITLKQYLDEFKEEKKKIQIEVCGN